jgi:hypothetical protein
VVASAPRIAPELIAALERLDDPSIPIAEIARRLGSEADRLGVPRPSYDRVRELVHERRLLVRLLEVSDLLVSITQRPRP